MSSRQLYDGTPTTVITGTGTLPDGQFSTSTNATEVDFDNTTDLWPIGRAVLSCSASTAPDDQSMVHLIQFQSGVDEPTASDIQAGVRVASFKLHNVTTQQQPEPQIISLIGVKTTVGFSIENQSGQTIDSDFTVTIEGLTLEDV